MNPDQLKQILASHAAWLEGELEGKRVDLHRADLRRANLYGADLRGADLREADLRGADLREADLRGADLLEADLQGADLQGANLRKADFHGANLRGVKLDQYIITKGENYTYLNGAYWFYKNEVDLTRLDGPLLELARLHI